MLLINNELKTFYAQKAFQNEILNSKNNEMHPKTGRGSASFLGNHPSIKVRLFWEGGLRA